jgi:cytochrome c oxidase subunit II
VRARRTVLLLGPCMWLAGCAAERRTQSALSPQGERADAVEPLWLTMLWAGTAVWALVTAALIWAVVRRRHGKPDQEEGRRVTRTVVLLGAVIPGVVVAALTVQSVLVLRDTASDDVADDALVVEVIGHQYWWEVRYPDAGVVTANEVHIPTGERVQFVLTSADVIHSFWVPELGGKMDLVPGSTNTTWLETDRPGEYWGQCAEFCGLQHAKMRLVVVAHEPAEFDGWLSHEQEPAEEAAPEPLDETAVDGEDLLIARGREVFMSSSCVYCHTIAGTAARGDVGPDLTHLAGRDTIAAGTLPNERGYLAAWIVDPQALKPGNLMPGTDLEGEELQALLTYLESLE